MKTGSGLTFLAFLVAVCHWLEGGADPEAATAAKVGAAVAFGALGALGAFGAGGGAGGVGATAGGMGAAVTGLFRAAVSAAVILVISMPRFLFASLYVSVTLSWCSMRLVMRDFMPSNCAVVTAASGVDPSEVIVCDLERFCCGGLVDGRGSWKMGASPVLEGVGAAVGDLEELPEVRK